MAKAKKEALKRAVAVYERFMDANDEFDRRGVREAIAEACQEFRSAAFETFVDAICEGAEHKLAGKHAEQGSLFPGMIDTSGLLILGNNDRIAKRKSTYKHYLRALEVRRQNLEACRQKYEDDVAIGESLRPYWRGHRTMDQAREAYYGDHPEINPDSAS